MKKNKKIYFTGIKGVGMTPLAIIAKEAGFNVEGSDTKEKFITDETLKKLGILSVNDFSEKNITNDIGLLITTGAHGGFDNPEVKKARELGIRVLTQGEAVGEFMKGKILNKKIIGISIAGCHGKTTTTSIAVTLFKENKTDPTYIIGTSEIFSLAMPGHFGKSNYFIAEADEYATEPNYDKTPKLLWQTPQFIILTNLEFDHPDIYSSIDEIKNTFLKFISQNPDATVIYNADDPNLNEIIKKINNKKISFGFSEICDYRIKKVSLSEIQTFFWIEHKGTSLGEFSINTLGDFNALNALGAIILGIEVGFSVDGIKKGLMKFKGSKRRLEYKGKTLNNALVYDDYAHHPTEIKSTLHAFKKIFPKKKIICIFQSHTYSRTKSMFSEFTNSFSNCNLLILTRIYASERKSEKNDNLSKEFYQETLKNHPNTLFLPEFSNVIEYVEQKEYNSDYVIITIGAGTVYKIADKLIIKE